MKPSNTVSKLTMWYAIAVIVFVADQATKVWAENVLKGGKEIVLTSFFKFDLAYNTGAAFSFLRDGGGWQRWFFAVIAMVVSVGLIVWIAKLVREAKPGRGYELWALSLVLGGALGNLYDRIMLGHVVDFIVWHYQHYYWPTFNIADAGICVGAGLLIFDMLFVQDKQAS
ncbi:signal peptidase II [Aurantivibrio plasticivorans]